MATLDRFTHDHQFLGERHVRNERRTWAVVALTLVMMVGEIVAGLLFGSIALLADGWHMATHAGALGIAALAYRYARRHADDPRYSFGTGKVGDLAGFASAVGLGLVALFVAIEASVRLFEPVAIAFDQALAVATLGLAVNLVSAWLLHERHEHGHGAHDGHDERHHYAAGAHEHGHAHGHDHDHGALDHRDHNLRGAYLHVVADAATSVAAILGLGAGRLFGWNWMDPVMGLVGAAVIARWSWGLLRESSDVLLDIVPNDRLAREIRGQLEQGGDRVTDLHLWRVGPGHHALVLTLVSDHPQPAAAYKRKIGSLPSLCHVTVEVLPR